MQVEIAPFLKEMLLKQYGEEITIKIIDGYTRKKYVTLRVNTIKASVEEIKNELSEAEIEYEEINWYKEALIIKNVREDEIKKVNIYENGEIYLQRFT